MRGIAIALLAGLLAVAVPPASALCMDDGQGGCQAGTYAFTIDLRGDCPDGASLCVVDADGNLSQAPNGATYNLTIINSAGVAITFELFATAYADTPTSDSDDGRRIAADLLATIQVPAGQSVRLDDVAVAENVTHIRLQALAEDGRQAEVDQELLNFRILAMEPGSPEPGQEDEVIDAESKGSPALPLALLVVGCLAAVLAVRRFQ